MVSVSGSESAMERNSASEVEQAELRPPETVMRLDRMGSSFPTRLSFMRILIRELHQNDWHISPHVIALDEKGFGHVVLTAKGPERTYSLIAYSHDLDPDQRTDRVIAEAWDATFTLFDGIPTAADIERLVSEVPLQEAGRCSPKELVLSRANKSVRLFAHVVDSLVAGRQPDIAFVAQVGYLMRTTAVYGNGKFGVADRGRIAGRPELLAPFQAELLTVYLIRVFTYVLVEHVARARAPETFVPLDKEIKRFLGIGNATGLGMAPFMHSHPVLINNWVTARETALARVRAIRDAAPETLADFRRVLVRAQASVLEWTVDDLRQMERIEQLRSELTSIVSWVASPEFAAQPSPWDRLYTWVASEFSLESQELVAALMLEPHGLLVDDLALQMHADVSSHFDPAQTVGDLLNGIRDVYRWALDMDLTEDQAEHHFWYVSEEKLEPRLGVRREEPGAERELPLHVARDVQALARDLAEFDTEKITAAFLIAHPEHRHIVKRVQTTFRNPYSEIRDNLVGADLLAIDLLRFKLAFFGATKFDPKSDRWTRITMYQGAPLPDELAAPGADDWAFSIRPDQPE